MPEWEADLPIFGEVFVVLGRIWYEVFCGESEMGRALKFGKISGFLLLQHLRSFPGEWSGCGGQGEFSNYS